ncbi:MAG: pantoate--beta-alanine ligase, partial [Phycisphaerales bacterium]|nr:pantoate--beta-alanine ligase [Phycisphaerales bacterium]
CEQLFRLVQPAVAVFGEKDWQQFQLMRVLVRQEGLPVEIEPGPTVRSPEGLALSSRNRFIPEDRHDDALALSRGLVASRDGATVGEGEAILHRTLREAGVEWDYATIRDPESLRPLDPDLDASTRARALVAARIGDVRLLDNMPWGAWS